MVHFLYLLIRFWCVLIMTGIVYMHRINILFLVICVCTLGIKYCHHYILFLSLRRQLFVAFSCNIHHEERYLKFADISFGNIDTAKKYRDNIDTFCDDIPALLAMRLRRSVRGDGGQAGAVLETETRSALEYKDKISVFKRVKYAYCLNIYLECILLVLLNTSHSRSKDIVIYILRGTLCFLLLLFFSMVW